MSVFFNTLFFLAAIAHNPPSWYTNDDFRMMTIVSGAYSGTPNPDIVFMRYPVGLLLSGLYRITTNVPWYGIFTMLCMFVPSCVFCYYIIKKAYEKNRVFLGILLYFLLFMFFVHFNLCIFRCRRFCAAARNAGRKQQKAYCPCCVVCRAIVFHSLESILFNTAGAFMGDCRPHIKG